MTLAFGGRQGLDVAYPSAPSSYLRHASLSQGTEGLGVCVLEAASPKEKGLG